MVCPKCGAQTVAGASFCTRCGTPLGQVAAAAVVPGAPAPADSMVHHAHGPAERSLHFLALGGVGCLSLVLGCIVLVILLSQAHSLAAFIVALIMAVLPVPIYAALIVSLDRHVREPVWLLVGAFFWGAIVAVMFAFFINTGMASVLAAIMGPGWSNVLTPSLVAPVVEETSKGLALLLIFLFLRVQLNDVVDGIVLGALVGLGFAMTENILYFSRAFNAGGFVGVTLLFFVRVIMNGFGHSLYTGSTGAGLGLAEETTNPVVRWVAPFAGYFLAIFLHFLWNTVSGLTGNIQAPAAVQLFVIVPFMAAFLSLPGILAMIAIAFFAWRRESKVITEQLKDEVDGGVVRSGEYALLGNDRARARRIWHMLFAYGPLAWYLVRQFYNLEIALAFRKWHTARGEPVPSYLRGLSEAAYRERITALRTRLTQMGVSTE